VNETTSPAVPRTEAPQCVVTRLTVSYDHPDNAPLLNPVNYTRAVPVASLYRLIDLLDELAADATGPSPDTHKE
jgi:hypothetical protein